MTIRGYIDIVERYTQNNKWFRDYMRDPKFDYYNFWAYVCEWLFDHYDAEDINDLLSVDVEDADELAEMNPELFNELPPNVQKKCAEQVIEQIMRDDPTEAPTDAYMSMSNNQLIHRQTWLIHFSDYADDIRREGFTRGVDQMDKLGLTTYLNGYEKEGNGYNFAVEADSRDARVIAHDRKYGNDAVMFRNSGVKAWHSCDEEHQVVFWGADVDPKSIIYLSRDGDEWTVQSRRELRNGETDLFTGSFSDAVNWVMANADRYRKVL